MAKGHYKRFTPEQEEMIKRDYLVRPVKQLCDITGSSYGTIMGYLKRNNLVIPPEVVEKRKRDSYLKKGNVPINKGKKMKDVLSPESLKKMESNYFKKGHVPHNAHFDGAIVPRKDSRGVTYLHIRISKANWEYYHRYIWEQANGKIPKGSVIRFKDGNTQNVELSNLEMITKIENMFTNSAHDYPTEVIPTMAIIKQLEKQINNLENGK